VGVILILHPATQKQSAKRRDPKENKEMGLIAAPPAFLSAHFITLKLYNISHRAALS